MTLLVLAAGLGSRYGGNKQFDGVGPNQEYLLEYNMYDAILAGVQKIVIVTRKEALESTQEYFAARLPENIEIQCVEQSIGDTPNGFQLLVDRKKPWGTAHAVWSARNAIQGKFATVNADDLYGRNGLRAALQCMSDRPSSGEYGLVGYQLKDTLSSFGTVSRGVCSEESGYLTHVVERTKLRRENASNIIDETSGKAFTGNELTSMNLWVCDDSIFSAIKQFFLQYFENRSNQESGEIYLPLIIQDLIDRNAASVALIDSKSEWHGMTYKEDKSQLREVLQKAVKENVYPSPLWSKA